MEYLKISHNFLKRISRENMPRREKRYLFFRMACPIMQNEFQKLAPVDRIPKTFIHGNPHLDNYVKTERGSAMIDFDRSRIGPYAWDIVRFLSSVSLRRDHHDSFLHSDVVEHFLDAYIVHFLNVDIPAKQLRLLKNISPEKWQTSTKEYLKANKKWAKKMRDYSLYLKHDYAHELLKKYLISIKEDHLLSDFKVSEIGHTPGSLGKRHYIYSLVPKREDSFQDSILFDIKEVYRERDNKYFFSPVPHHGERMVIASKIFAEGMEQRIGFCTHHQHQYWGRQIPSFAVKVKKFLSLDEQCDFAYSVGSELGKGHRRGLSDQKLAPLIEKDLMRNFDLYHRIAQHQTAKINLAFETTLKLDEIGQEFLNRE